MGGGGGREGRGVTRKNIFWLDSVRGISSLHHALPFLPLSFKCVFVFVSSRTHPPTHTLPSYIDVLWVCDTMGVVLYFLQICV